MGMLLEMAGRQLAASDKMKSSSLELARLRRTVVPVAQIQDQLDTIRLFADNPAKSELERNSLLFDAFFFSYRLYFMRKKKCSEKNSLFFFFF